MSGRAGARRLVEDICKEHGYIPPEILDRLSKADRDVIVQAMLSKDKLIASSITTLAQNLYTSNARFVFELLQNCDDNHYNNARARDEVPYVSFNIYPDRIIMECNEDGFEPENLTAICNVGQSSKTGAQGYIGEKGIGFKSVFMVAYKAHIQSGDFSFHFLHRNGDSGLGMITPVWQDHEDDLEDHLTRITLLLHNDGDSAALEKQRQTTGQQLREIHDTILLFMKNMEWIEIVFYDDDEEVEFTTTYSIDRQTDNRVAVTKHTSEDGEEQEDVRYYHTTKHVATNLAGNENRTYSDKEMETMAYSRSEVVLAFPLDEDSVPVIDNQWIFAFLPVRQMGFKFLIQADFVTQANRQDIVTTSLRNEGLANGIAEAFVKAVLQFCQHDTLQYQWMRYLPQEDGYPWDGFWKSLIQKIGDQLKRTPVMRPVKPGPLQLLSACRRLPPMQLDKHGKPLFADIAPERYLSLDYGRRDLDLLGKHGLPFMSFCEAIVRVAHDLASSKSRMKSTVDEDWQSRVALLLNLPFADSRQDGKDRVKQLDLLPLRDGSWTTIKSGNVYYPRVGGTDLDIPLGLDLKVVDPKAVANAQRKQLFGSIGVQTASVSFIREAIFNIHTRLFFSIILKVAASHLRFLYMTQHLTKTPYSYDRLYLVTEQKKVQSYGSADFYIRDDSPYGAAQLLDPVDDESDSENNAPGFNVSILHGAYFKDTPIPQTRDSLSWKEWLHECFKVRRHLRLIDKDGAKLSDICHYVAEHRPKKFLGFLQATWELEWPLAAMEKEDIIDELGWVDVLCEDNEMRPFDTTYLPTTDLKQLSSRFLLEGEYFPWLQLETEPIYNTFPPQWDALGKAFGLGSKGPDTTFILDVLDYILDQNESAEDMVRPERVYELYVYLQSEVRKSSEPGILEELIRNQFLSRPSIFIPEGADQRPAWAHAEECVWESPIEMMTKYSLAKLYEADFERFGTDRSNLANFFSGTLEIPNYDWEDLIEEIREFKSSDCTDFDRVSELYKCLADERLTDISAEQLRKTFEAEALICGSENQVVSWHKTAQCLWTSATQIRGMLTLKELYPHLRSFFVKNVGVQTMTAKMVYDKLTGPELSVEEAKQTLETFNSLLRVSKRGEFDPAPVLQKTVFPVKFPNGHVSLLKGSDDFALLDRKSLGDDFAAKAKFLDFSMDKTRDLRPLIEWAGLEKRYLSKVVKEISAADEDSTRPISSPYREIKPKARALLSIAMAYNSPRTKGNHEAFYNLLRSSETLETDKITSELHLHQDGKLLRVEKATADLHIRENPTSLTIYVPEDETSQDFCFNSKLPQLLCEWIMTEPTSRILEHVHQEAVNAVQSVLNVKKSRALAKVLDHHGVTLLDDPAEEAEELEREEAHESEREQVEELEGEDHGVAGPAGPRTPLRPNIQVLQSRTPDNHRSDSSATEYLGTDTPPSSVHSPTASRSPRNEGISCLTAGSSYASSARPRLQPVDVDSSVPDSGEYTTLLHKVVNAARRTGFPSQGAFDMSAIQAALGSSTLDEGDEDPYRPRSISKLERDKQVGAAGELFVFELLSRLDIPLSGFSRANWQSTIRSYVTSHPDYSDMRPWKGRETADITYADYNSTLANLLIDKGYLASDVWAGARLQYYIEVKTTTGPCETPFYMSKHQYKRMQDKSNTAGGRRTENLYVIFRVFNLGSDSVGLKVLVDPESMRRRGELVFTTETWAVTIGA